MMAFLLFKLLEKTKLKLRSYRFSSLFGLVIIGLSGLNFWALTFDSSFKLKNDADFQLIKQHFAFFKEDKGF